jgi:hypothetical protein
MTQAQSSDEALAEIDATLDDYVQWDGSVDSASWAADGSHERDAECNPWAATSPMAREDLVAVYRDMAAQDQYHPSEVGEHYARYLESVRDLAFAMAFPRIQQGAGAPIGLFVIDEARTITATDLAEIIGVGGRRAGRTASLEALVAEYGLIDARPQEEPAAPYGGPAGEQPALEADPRPTVTGVRAQQSPYGPQRPGRAR